MTEKHMPGDTHALTPFWNTFLNDARTTRSAIWSSLLRDFERDGHFLPPIAGTIAKLYQDLRIDFDDARAALMRGSLRGVTVDPRPEDTIAADDAIADTWLQWFVAVEDEVCEASGLSEIDFSNPKHDRIFSDLSQELRRDGHLVNPLY